MLLDDSIIDTLKQEQLIVDYNMVDLPEFNREDHEFRITHLVGWGLSSSSMII